MSENSLSIKKGLNSIYNDEIENSVIGGYSITELTLFGILGGMLFPLIAWGYDIIANSVQISPKEIWKMHLANPLHFIIDIAPFVLGAFANIMAKRTRKRRETLMQVLFERNEIIRKNTELANRIGQGDFDVETAHIEKEDRLGNALLLMLNNLRETDIKENEQSWIVRGKEKVSDVLRQQNNIADLAFKTLVSLIESTEMVQGAFYLFDDERKYLINIATYAYGRKKYINQEFRIGEGLAGQAAFEKEMIYRTEVPEGYITITSGIIGDKKPGSVIVTPLISDEKLQGVIELASVYDSLPNKTLMLVQEVSGIIAQTLFNLKVNTRTENLLRESQKLANTLKANEDVLRQNAKEMKHTQLELQRSNRNLAAQIEEVEKGQKRLHSLLENASEVISIYDQNGIVKYVSPSVTTILGYQTDEMIGTNRFERGESILLEAFKELIENPQTVKTFEYRYEKKNHGIVWLETTGRNLLDNPAINGIIFNTRDITVRKVAEDAQRMSGEMQALSENSPDMIVRLSPEGKFFYANPVVEKITGILRAGLRQKKLSEVQFNPEIIHFFEDGIENVMLTKRKFEGEKTLPTVEGKRIMQVNVIPEFNKNHDVETILFVAHDITQRKNIEIEIEKKNKDITESINYAQRIQSAIIPDTKLIKQFIPNSFIFYKPRDIVSGDFPWFYVAGDNIYIAAVDCTGHGVPGALLSFIGYFLLNSIVDHDKNLTAGQVLDMLHNGVRRTLRQDADDASARDGMDIGLCKINYNKKELQYAAAHRPLYYVSGEDVAQYKGNSKAIGGIPPRRGEEEEFTNYIINYKPGDRIYFFSDGLPDQIGGDSGRKYQARRIRDAVLKYHQAPIDEVEKFFREDFKDWKGDQKQIDDVLLIGIEF
ncbi:MAG: PAS domain S-box protein [Bacteroidales bacterium]